MAADACGVCQGPLPAQRTGRPRKYHPGRCAADARRLRAGVRRPQGGPCQLCGSTVFDPGQRYYCTPACAARVDAVLRAERDMWRALEAAQERGSSPASAGELREGMSETAIRWRIRRAERLARLGRAG